MIRHLMVAALALLAAPLAARADCQVTEILELPVVMQGLRPTVPAKVNGADARFVLDSGDYESWITASGATRLGLKATLDMSDYRIQSAGGSPTTTVKTFTLGGVVFKGVAFQIDDDAAGKDIDGFIGQKLLKVADVDYDLHGGVVRLMRPTDCGDQPLAYWLKPGETFGVAELTSSGVFGTEATATATINGVKVTVGFSTGDTVSVLTLAAAKRAGISLHDPGVVTAGTTTSGGDPVQVWTAPIKSFEFAGEAVRNTRLRVTSADITGYDLILGTDFFLSHHLYFANGQHKLYVTYAGGSVFSAYNEGSTSGRH
ncbi:MAG TPA: pepsin/retropepsin-like aspartic protease family protein [Caulobacteraceae bacterium]